MPAPVKTRIRSASRTRLTSSVSFWLSADMMLPVLESVGFERRGFERFPARLDPNLLDLRREAAPDIARDALVRHDLFAQALDPSLKLGRRAPGAALFTHQYRRDPAVRPYRG